MAAAALGHTLLVFDAFHDLVEHGRGGNAHAAVRPPIVGGRRLVHRPARPCPTRIHLTVFKVDGEINTDDLSPATEAWSRADIPLHALSLLANRTDVDDPIAQIAAA